jgi:hypothetical protein
MDVHVPRAITEGLRLRGVDVLTAQEDGRGTLDDSALLDRVTTLGWVLFSHDRDMLAEAAGRHRERVAFSGLIYAHPTRVSTGGCVRDLELLAKACTQKDFEGRVEYLPLR